MALPTLDSVFASAADQPRKYMLAQWLVNELGSGAIADYVTLPERYLWAKIAVAAGGTKDEAAYIGLPKQYAWKDIYNAVSGSSLGTIDWSEKQALGRIAAAYRGDTANPANLATYIDWPWRYQVASIITSLLTPPEPEGFNAMIVSGAGSAEANGTYLLDGESEGKPRYTIVGGTTDTNSIFNMGELWNIQSFYGQLELVVYETPDLVVGWGSLLGVEPAPTVTGTNV